MRKKATSGVLASFAAALRDGLFAHLAGYSGTETVHELIVA